MKLILNGGGSGTSSKLARQKLNEVIDHSKKCLYIPLAWQDKTFKGCLEFILEELKDVDYSGIDIVKSKEELFNKTLNDYSFIYIGGGNTFNLLKDLKESGSYDKIKDYLADDGVVYGGSAGAIIFGKDLDACKLEDKNEVNLKDITGFNLLNGYSLLCHFTNKSKEKTEQSKKYLLELSKTKSIYGLPEEVTIYIDGNSINFVGTKPYFEFKNGQVYEIYPEKYF